MLTWLYDILVSIFTFITSLFGFNLKKRSVHFKDEIKDEVEIKDKVEIENEVDTR